MILKELIEWLELRDPNTVLPYGFNHPHSYRGYYERLAFEPTENITIRAMLADARRALGTTYEGYKGGSYTMHEYTDVYLANYGSTGEELSALTLDAMLLMSVFPDLVAACKAALARIESDISSTCSEAIQLRAALAKASAE